MCLCVRCGLVCCCLRCAVFCYRCLCASFVIHNALLYGVGLTNVVVCLVCDVCVCLMLSGLRFVTLCDYVGLGV